MIKRDGSVEEALFHFLLHPEKFTYTLANQTRGRSLTRLNKEESDIAQYIINTYIEELGESLMDTSNIVSDTSKRSSTQFIDAILKYANDESKVYLMLKLSI